VDILKKTTPDKLLNAITELYEGGAPMVARLPVKWLLHLKVSLLQ
jgi:hypothetical protein